MGIGNAYRTTDGFVMAVAFDGAVPAQGYTVASWREEPEVWDRTTHFGEASVRRFASVGSKAAVMASGGDKMWQDTANNLVWFKFQGGLTYPGEANFVKNSNVELFRGYSVVIYPK